MTDLSTLSVSDLLRLHAGALDELRRRGILRSANGPAGDYAEILFSRAFGWRLEGNSASGFDAVDGGGTRFQIKCRRLTGPRMSRQLSALRNLPQRPFDILAAVLLDADYTVHKAALIPIDVVIAESTFTSHVNAHRFILRDRVWSIPGVVDATAQLQAAQHLI